MTMKLPNVETVKAVRKLLSDPNRWHKGYFVNKPYEDTNLDDSFVELRDKEDACFCLLGAFYACSDIGAEPTEGVGRFITVQVNDLLKPCLVAKHPGKYEAWVPSFNDDYYTSHNDVLELLDCTIERLEVEAQQ